MTWRLTKMNLAIRGIEAQIAHGDTSRADKPPDLKADYVLANRRNGPTQLERNTTYEALRGELEKRDHVVDIVPLVSGLHGIERVAGGWCGGADPRREGTVAGD